MLSGVEVRSTILRAGAAAVALTALVAAAWTAQVVFVAMAAAVLLVVAMLFSPTGRFTALFTALIGHRVEIEVWGAPLPIAPGAMKTFQSARALGAGLHLLCAGAG